MSSMLHSTITNSYMTFLHAEDVDAAILMENNLPRTYNYAWNIRSNGVRPILNYADMWW